MGGRAALWAGALTLAACAQDITVARDSGYSREDGGGVRLDSGVFADAGKDASGSFDGAPPPRDGSFAFDASSTGDAHGFDAVGFDRPPPFDSGAADALPFDAFVPPADAGGGLDPDLALPDPNGTPCTAPGSLTECPGIEVCRFYTPQEGRCESCTECGNLNAFCTLSSECDILFMCYLGRCTNFCTLGTFECGPIEDCIDIGHPTRGVCIPN